MLIIESEDNRMSWQGKILRVDLTAKSIRIDPLNMTWAHEFLGSRGLAGKYLYDEMNPKTEALSPENVLIFASGPLTGTMASTGGRYTVVTKGALTNSFACSNSGGYFGAEFKFAGYDMIIIKGKAPNPVYLIINNEVAEILDAQNFIWGKSVWETEEKIKERHRDPLIRVASIGEAGENLVRYACIINDRDRAAGRSGVGAVMGSKLLKAIAVRGSKGVIPNKPAEFLEAVNLSREKLDTHPSRKRLMTSGTMPMMDNTNAYGSLPTHNCRDVQFSEIEKVNVEAMKATRNSDGRANLISNKACFGCSIACGRVSKIDPNHFSMQIPLKKRLYGGAIGGLEYESGFSLAPMVGINDIEAATYANMLCNVHGMDPISFGVTIAAAMELYETKAIDDTITGGIKLKFGNSKALCELAELTGLGKGFGIEIGLGAKRLCEKYGHPEFAMVVKGQEFPGYDVRAMQGMALAYATSSRGACHMRASPFADDFVYIRPHGKAKIVKTTQDKNAAIDSTGCCAFAGNAWDLEDYAAQIHGACDGIWDAQRLMTVGERIFNLERMFNLNAGIDSSEDTLPNRMLKEVAKSGAGRGRVAELDKMLPEYYQIRGWKRDGTISISTKKRLNLI